MNKKTLTILFVASALLFSIFLSAVQISSQSQDTKVTILADGSVVGTDKIQQSGNTYTLTADLNVPIVIEKRNIVLNGAGFTIKGLSNWGQNQNQTAISVIAGADVVIQNVQISNFSVGLGINDSSNCILRGNIIYNDGVGIFASNSCGLWIDQNNIQATLTNAIESYYSNNIIVSANNLRNNIGGGISVYGNKLPPTGTDNVISSNLLDNNSANFGGSILIESSNNTIIGNTVSNSHGISIYGNGNLVTKNNFFNCNAAVSFAGYNNTFLENNFTGNPVVALSNVISPTNVFFNNNFINNTALDTQTWMYSQPSGPSWDNGTLGNYYSDYLTQNPNSTEVDRTGIYNTPYTIIEHLTYHTDHDYAFYDNHPLVNPVEITQPPIAVPSWKIAVPQANPNFFNIIILIVIVLMTLILFVIYLSKRMKRSL